MKRVVRLSAPTADDMTLILNAWFTENQNKNVLNLDIMPDFARRTNECMSGYVAFICYKENN